MPERLAAKRVRHVHSVRGSCALVVRTKAAHAALSRRTSEAIRTIKSLLRGITPLIAHFINGIDPLLTQGNSRTASIRD